MPQGLLPADEMEAGNVCLLSHDNPLVDVLLGHGGEQIRAAVFLGIQGPRAAQRRIGQPFLTHNVFQDRAQFRGGASHHGDLGPDQSVLAVASRP